MKDAAIESSKEIFSYSHTFYKYN